MRLCSLISHVATAPTVFASTIPANGHWISFLSVAMRHEDFVLTLSHRPSAVGYFYICKGHRSGASPAYTNRLPRPPTIPAFTDGASDQYHLNREGKCDGENGEAKGTGRGTMERASLPQQSLITRLTVAAWSPSRAN